MTEGRFELPHPFGRYHLKVVRLPISPFSQTNELKAHFLERTANIEILRQKENSRESEFSELEDFSEFTPALKVFATKEN